MHIAGSNRFFLKPGEKVTLIARMAKDGGRSPKNLMPMEDMEEGEISEDSVEEISEEDFKQQDATRVSSRSTRVWTGKPLPFPTLGYASNLYNFAWAQAVQNKPLGNFGFEELQPVAARFVSDGLDGIDRSEKSNARMEKEEGELEEGEIQLRPPAVDVVGEVVCDLLPPSEEENVMEVLVDFDKRVGSSEEKKEPEKEMEEMGEFDNRVGSTEENNEPENEMEVMGDFDLRVGIILEELETITMEDAQKSFEGVCSRLQKTLQSLQHMVSESHIPVLDALVQQAFMGIQTVHSVFPKERQNKDVLSRLLVHIKNQLRALFTPEQMKEINGMMQSVVSEAADKEKERKPCLEPISVNSIGSRNARDISASSKLIKLEPLNIPKSRVDYCPLLNPHANHDEGSLPSPTRENALPSLKSCGSGVGAVISPPTTCKQGAEDATLHPYVTDALKAVSSYQQKYCCTSFLPTNRLPSPTPSEECNDDDDDNVHEEVSSSSVVSSVGALSSSIPLQPVGSSSGTTVTDISSGQGLHPGRMVGQMDFRPKPVVKVSAKSRDPRLRFANSEVGSSLDLNKQPLPLNNSVSKNGLTGEVMNSRKHKVSDEVMLDNHTLKRQRNGFSNSRDLQMSTGKGGWLEDNGAVAVQLGDRSQSMESMEVENRKLENGETASNKRQDINLKGTNVRNEQITSMSTAPVVSLPNLLKDVAVNPTMLMQLIKEQQRLTAEAQQKSVSSVQGATHPSSTNRLLGKLSSVKSIPLRVSEPVPKPRENPQMPAQTASMNSQNDAGRIRMKPRDPRRILQNNLVEKSENLGPEQLKANGASSNIQRSNDCLTVHEQGEQSQSTLLPSQSNPLPDITKLFTNNLKNLADIMSTSQVANNTPAVPQNISQTIPTTTDKMDVRPMATESNNQQNTAVVTHEGPRTGALQSLNPWGDVDHLLDGYDDQQKAAIQIERTRRIEEQNKMFAARKLCLVLDLDHTLLNSAKFVEVDQVHDEILRKKEEQDREKLQRHLFRLPHMGMWTKLRPGIWNFLEKVSKLYELHLYTMGNKLYATEMAKVLDPTGALFAGRVISKGDDTDFLDGDERVPKSKDLDGVLGMESAVVIIDDSVRVWPHNKLNLIVVERYTYFPFSRRQFGLHGPSLLEIDHDERSEDGTLASSLAVIERIHQNFFSHHCLNDVDVRNILASEQRKILSGCRIVFSRIFPVGEAHPHLHPLWQTAEQFGAVCSSQIDDQVTHVVANSLGTDKVNWALSTGRFVVHPGWVEASALLYRRANENDFAVKI